MTKYQKMNSALTVGISIIIIATLVLLFVPYYTEGGTNVSLAGYTWFPTDHQALTAEIASSVDGHSVDDILTETILIPLAGIVVLVLLSYFDYSKITSILSVVWSLWAFIWYAKDSVMKLGSQWSAFIVLFVAISILSIVLTYVRSHSDKEEKEAEHSSEYKNQPVTSN
ncbi:MAG: hypothetical protein GX783_13940 [Clostridiales bacterium]|nr:hypothetical protein [Clostridiales bacterium]